MPLLIAFAGQGAQHRKMFDVLGGDTFGKPWLKEASDIIHIDLLDESAVEKACADVILVQCLIVIQSVGTFYALKKNINLDAASLCGYSLGEISAFSVSANLNLTEICSLVKNRARFMQQAAIEFTQHQASGLAALKGMINYQQMQDLIHSYRCYLAIINAKDHYIIGGLSTDLDALILEAKTNGVIKAERLPINLPSHTLMLAKATDNFSNYLKILSSQAMQYPILNALTQVQIDSTQDMLPILARELSETLHWDNVMEIAAEYGISLFLELGPGAALKNMAVARFPSLKAYNLEGFSSVDGLIRLLKNS